MTRSGSMILALCVAGACLADAPAEITHREEGGQIVITNLPTSRKIVRHGRSALAAGRKASGSASLPSAPPTIAEFIDGASARYGFDPGLIRAVVAAESAFDHLAVSKKGARGLMQLMPETAKRYGVRDMHDPASNLEAGVIYLRELVGRFGGNVTMALAAYNAGPDAVARYGGVPPYDETRKYLDNIRAYYGPDLDAGDWSSRETGIHVVKVDKAGVPVFTNLPSRRLVGGSVHVKGGTGKSK